MAKASTAAERAAAVDKEMEAALAEMDDLLLKEKKVLAQERSAAMSAPAESSGSSGARAGGGPAASGASGGQSSPAESGASAGGGANTSGDAGTATAGPHNAAGSPQDSDAEGETEKQRVPADIPDGRDDDIVARQLREAAVTEDDPALREKLWDEYRKYKSGQK